MAKSKMTELKKLSVDELIKTNEAKRAELFALKFQASIGSLEQTHRIKEIKKEIARIELMLWEKRQSGENTNKRIKADYNQAVAEAEKAGKEVRAKQRQLLQEQLGQQPDMNNQEDAIQKAMQMAVEQTETQNSENQVKVEEQTNTNKGE